MPKLLEVTATGKAKPTLTFLCSGFERPDKKTTIKDKQGLDLHNSWSLLTIVIFHNVGFFVLWEKVVWHLPLLQHVACCYCGYSAGKAASSNLEVHSTIDLSNLPRFHAHIRKCCTFGGKFDHNTVKCFQPRRLERSGQILYILTWCFVLTRSHISSCTGLCHQ